MPGKMSFLLLWEPRGQTENGAWWKQSPGCPARHDFAWYQGKAVVNALIGYILWTQSLHWPVIPKKLGETIYTFQHDFCMKHSDGTGDWNNSEWPKGDYCVFLASSNCLPGFTCGYTAMMTFCDSDGSIPEGTCDVWVKQWYALP